MPHPAIFPLFLLLFVPLNNRFTSGSGHHQPCLIEKENNIFKANCANYSLPAVPVYLSTNTWELNLDNNKLELWRPSEHFSKYLNLRNLTIGNNSLTSIHQDTFKYLKNLLRLNLWGNSFTEVPSDALLDLRALQFLSLEGNRIKILRRDAFYNLNNLTELKLSGNNIIQVEMGALSGLVKLQHFQIQHNALLSLPPSLFEDCEQNLKTLLLYSNPWHCDCQLRWLVDYINTTGMKWLDRAQVPRCDTPMKLNYKPFLSVPFNLFACRVLMDSSNIKMRVEKGKNVTLMCKVQSNPPANITWLLDNKLLKNVDGYSIQELGSTNNQNSILFIEDFGRRSIGKYKCLAKNPISENSVIYTLDIDGVEAYMQPRIDRKTNSSIGADTTTIIVASGIVCAIVLVIVFSVLAFIFWRRFSKVQRAKEEELKLKINKHFESNDDYKHDTINKKALHIPQIDSEEMDMFYLKKSHDKMEPLFEKISHLPNGGTYMSFRTEPLDSELNAPSTILTNLDSQSDNNGMFWTEVSRNDTSSNLSELACPLLDPPGDYNSGNDTWDRSSEVFPHLYTSSYPRHPGTFNSIHSFHPYTHDSSNSMTLNSPSNMDYSLQDSIYNRSFSAATSQSGSEDHTKRSASVGSLGLVAIPPKKPPRLHSNSSIAQSETNGKLTLPKPGSIDEFGTAV